MVFDKPFGSAVSWLLRVLRTSNNAKGGLAIPDQSSLSYYAYRLMGTLMPLVPPRLGYALFDRIGDLAHDRSKASHDNVYDNLRHVLGPETEHARLEQVARQIFRHQARNYFDLFRVASLSGDEIRDLVTVHGLDNIGRALEAGKGVIMFTAHFGNLDIAGQMFALEGYPVTIVAEHLQPERLFQYVSSLRASKGLKLIPSDEFLRPLYRALRNNEIVGLAADRNLTGTGSLVSFFGAPALLPDGHVRLALRTGAKLLPAFSLRKPDNSYEAVAEPALELETTGDSERDIASAMASLVGVVERYIGKHPEQWVMFQPVWALPEQMSTA